jgi:hypothetical protein
MRAVLSPYYADSVVCLSRAKVVLPRNTMSTRQQVIRLAASLEPAHPLRVALVSLLAADRPIGKAKYKGKTYNLLFMGPTKYGERARLQFLDGTKDFWVDAGLVEKLPGGGSSGGGSSSRGRGGRYECDECGEYVTPGTICWETGMRH